MKKIIKILLVLAFVVVGYLCGSKVFYLKNYDVTKINPNNYQIFIEAIKNSDIISTDEKAKNTISYEGITFKNIFNKFNKVKDKSLDGLKYELKDGKNTKAVVTIKKVDSVLANNLEMISSELDVFASSEKELDLGTKEERRNFLKENNITTEKDYLMYLKESYNKKNNLFTKKYDIKMKYVMHFIASITFPEVSKITFVDGKNSGYVLKMEKAYEIKIGKEKETYIIDLFGLDYFTDEIVNDFVKSIIIK